MSPAKILFGVFMNARSEPLAATARIVSVEGPLRLPHTGELTRRVHRLHQRGIRLIVVDLGRVPRIDAAGVGELVRAYNMTTAAGGTLRIVHATRWVRDVLERTGLFEVLSGFESVPAIPSEAPVNDR